MATKLDTKPDPKTYVVGGVTLDRPFKIRRLGHFGFNVDRFDECLRFYRELLGFRVSDPIDFGSRFSPELRASLGRTVGYFMRHGTDHHSFVLFPRRTVAEMVKLRGRTPNAAITINQITWQVGTLREITEANDWFAAGGVHTVRSGRDMPGSNWHVYPLDPMGHTNELYYGIEQVGWDGLSKPRAMFDQEHNVAPPLPQIAEITELHNALERKVDLVSGTRAVDNEPASYDVGGILLPRPFKITKIGPVRLFVADFDRTLAFYRDRLGLSVTEETTWRGHRSVFLRTNTEHHSLALHPLALRDELGLSAHTTCFSFGVQLGNYGQLRDAVEFLKAKGVAIKYLDPALSPGVDYCAFAIDPDGHAIQLYYYMEQLGWDGKPRPAAQRRKIDNANWPATLVPMSDTYGGETFLGPIG